VNSAHVDLKVGLFAHKHSKHATAAGAATPPDPGGIPWLEAPTEGAHTAYLNRYHGFAAMYPALKNSW